jgi:tetratricopeptide (TPR) repeat protein
MRAIFDRVLCCHRHHPEVWLSLARFELSAASDATPAGATKQDAGSTGEAKAILREALGCNPQVASLRVALAELEEESGDLEAAKDTLRTAFNAMPSGFTFSVLQRLVRRTEGIVAARRCFSDTMSLRCDGSLDHEVRR